MPFIKNFLVSIIDTNNNEHKFIQKGYCANDIIGNLRINRLNDKFLYESSYNINEGIEEMFLVKTDNIVSIKVTEINES